MTVEINKYIENSAKFVHKTNSYCERYDCSKCPMRIGTMCFYDDQDYLRKRKRWGN